MFYKYLLVLFFTILIEVINAKEIVVDELTPEELEILGKINSKAGNVAFMSNFQTPECTCENLTCICCLKFSLANLERELCLDAGFNKNDMKANVQLTFNREEIFKYSLRVTKVCANLPIPLSKVEICINAYKIDLKDMPQNGMFCMEAKLSLFLIPFLTIDFNCIKWQQEHITIKQLDNIKDAITVNVNVQNGGLEMTLNTPIPEDVRQQIRKLSQHIASVISENNKKYAELVKQHPDKYGSEAYKWNLFMNIWKSSIV